MTGRVSVMCANPVYAQHVCGRFVRYPERVAQRARTYSETYSQDLHTRLKRCTYLQYWITYLIFFRRNPCSCVMGDLPVFVRESIALFMINTDAQKLRE